MSTSRVGCPHGVVVLGSTQGNIDSEQAKQAKQASEQAEEASKQASCLARQTKKAKMKKKNAYQLCILCACCVTTCTSTTHTPRLAYMSDSPAMLFCACLKSLALRLTTRFFGFGFGLALGEGMGTFTTDTFRRFFRRFLRICWPASHGHPHANQVTSPQHHRKENKNNVSRQMTTTRSLVRELRTRETRQLNRTFARDSEREPACATAFVHARHQHQSIRVTNFILILLILVVAIPITTVFLFSRVPCLCV